MRSQKRKMKKRQLSHNFLKCPLINVLLLTRSPQVPNIVLMLTCYSYYL